MAADDGRPLVDEQGRLFGAVNIIDALVVLFVAVIVIGGIWFVGFSESEPDGEPNGEGEATPGSETELRYATLDVGTVSPQVESQIETGDTVQTTQNANLTITDIYRAPADDALRVFVRVELVGRTVEQNGETQFKYAEKPPRIERELTLGTDRY
jgi:hypothetical protein